MERRSSLSTGRAREQLQDEIHRKKLELQAIEKDLAEHQKLRDEINQEPDESMRNVLLYSLEQSVSQKLSRQQTVLARLDKLTDRLRQVFTEEKIIREIEDRKRKEAEDKYREAERKRLEEERLRHPKEIQPKKFGSAHNFQFNSPYTANLIKSGAVPVFHFDPPVPKHPVGIVEKEVSQLDKKKDP